MAKKFRHEESKGEYQGADMGISLDQYVLKYAPDIFCKTAIMGDSSALAFFTDIFQPQQNNEGKRPVKTSIDWPYANRLIVHARNFLKLEIMSQRYVVKAAGAKIWWRGDEINNFRRIVEETISFRQLDADEKRQYRQRIMAIAKTFVSRYPHIEAA